MLLVAGSRVHREDRADRRVPTPAHAGTLPGARHARQRSRAGGETDLHQQALLRPLPPAHRRLLPLSLRHGLAGLCSCVLVVASISLSRRSLISLTLGRLFTRLCISR